MERLGKLKVESDTGVVHKIKHIASPCGEYRCACGFTERWEMPTTRKKVTCKKCLASDSINKFTT